MVEFISHTDIHTYNSFLFENIRLNHIFKKKRIIIKTKKKSVKAAEKQVNKLRFSRPNGRWLAFSFSLTHSAHMR